MKMDATSSRLYEDLGREPTDEELAAELETTTFQVVQIRMAAMRPVSLDAQVDGRDSPSYAETIADEQAGSPYEELADKTGLEDLREVLGTLTSREKTVLHSRFGLNGGRPKKLEEIGKQLRLTDERVRQIQNAALGKLRRGITRLAKGPAWAPCA